MARRALVTGASRGIGAAIARALARSGHTLVLNCRSESSEVLDVKHEIEKSGGRAELSYFDVTDREAVERELARLLESSDAIDVLVNNAGIVADAPFPTLKPEAWESVTRTTLDGFYNVTRPLVMPMVKKRWGRIINIASVSGLIGNRGQVNYSAAKAGLIGATRSLAQELAKRNITVNAVAPGIIDTDMTADMPPEVINQIPMRRSGKPEEVAALVAFLASDDAAYITGQVIGINGGLA